jgi:hypothetical protein
LRTAAGGETIKATMAKLATNRIEIRFGIVIVNKSMAAANAIAIGKIRMSGFSNIVILDVDHAR